MTDDARAKAVEAAAMALRDNALAELGEAPIGPFSASAEDVREYWLKRARIAMDAAERTMAEAGWVMVPREPTEAMQAAGGEYQYGPDPLYRAYNAARTWAAMHRASEEG